jgi:hypothetical protein
VQNSTNTSRDDFEIDEGIDYAAEDDEDIEDDEDEVDSEAMAFEATQREAAVEQRRKERETGVHFISKIDSNLI